MVVVMMMMMMMVFLSAVPEVPELKITGVAPPVVPQETMIVIGL